MANEEHLKILKQGVKAWNQWRKKNSDIEPDLAKANLDKADLSDADLSGAKTQWRSGLKRLSQSLSKSKVG